MWKDWSNTKKGLILGLIISIIFILISLVQIPACDYCNQHNNNPNQLKFNCRDSIRFLSCFPTSIASFFAWAWCGVESATESCKITNTLLIVLVESIFIWAIVFGIYKLVRGKRQ